MDLLSQINDAFPSAPPSIVLAEGPTVRMRYDDPAVYAARTQRDMLTLGAIAGWRVVSAEVDTIAHPVGCCVVSARLALAPSTPATVAPPSQPVVAPLPLDVEPGARGRNISLNARTNKPR